MRRKTKLIFLAVVLALAGMFVFDVLREPENQFLSRVYISTVHLYQAVGRPQLEGVVACRFRPTCSDYSIQAVESHGLIHGLDLTWKRIRSCQDSVPMGTVDEVPAD